MEEAVEADAVNEDNNRWRFACKTRMRATLGAVIQGVNEFEELKKAYSPPSRRGGRADQRISRYLKLGAAGEVKRLVQHDV